MGTCKKCGAILKDGARFCVECGTQINEEIIPEKKTKRKGFRKGIIIFAIAVLVYLGVQLLFNPGNNIEYSNNAGDKLPIVVNEIEIYENILLLDSCARFEVENLTDVDYKNARFVVLAWDNKGFPVKIDQPYVYSDADYYEYLEFFESDAIPSYETQTYECTFDFNDSDVGYMSVFLIEYEDFKGKMWENPILDSLEEIQGKKLDDTNLYYFTFSSY